MSQLLSLESINQLTGCIEKKNIQLKKKKDEFKNDPSKCYSCRGIGTIFLSDYTYGSSCSECCCNNCGEFHGDCECKYCKKCN
jgi:hypothetical protein